MSDKYFVNRHGTKAAMDQAISEIETNEAHANESKVVKNKYRLKTPRIKLPKKLWLVVIIVLLIIAVSALLLGDTARRDYQKQAAEIKSSVLTLTQQPISTQTSAVNASASLLKGLNKPTACTSKSPVFLTGLYKPANDAKKECDATVSKYAKLKEAVKTANDIAVYLEKASEATGAGLKTPDDGAFAEISSSQQAWTAASDSLNKLTPPNSIKTQHESFKTRVNAVSAAWTKLSQANAANDASGFAAAEADLAKAYESLRASGDEFDAVSNQLQKQINNSLDSLK